MLLNGSDQGQSNSACGKTDKSAYIVIQMTFGGAGRRVHNIFSSYLSNGGFSVAAVPHDF